MGLFGYLLRSARGPFLLAVAAGVVSGGTGAAFIAVVNAALADDRAAPAGQVWTYVGLCLATLATRFAAQSLLFRLSQGVIAGLRRRLVDAVLAAPLRRVEQLGTPRLYSALSDDVVVIADALPGLPAICSGAAFVLVSLVYLAVISPVVALTALAAAVLGVLAFRLFSGRGLAALGAARAEQDRLFELFRSVTDGLKELKLDRGRREQVAGGELDDTAAAYRRHSVRGLSVFEGAAGAGQAVLFGFVGVLLFLLPGWADLSAETLSASVLVVLFAVASLQGVLTWLPGLGRASVALATIERRLADLEAAGREELAGPAPEPGDWRRIELRGVAHVYPGPTGEQFELGPLDLDVRRGETLFVVGGNGSGKTTLAKVLTGLYPPERGGIRVDGVPVTDAGRDAYRQLFAAVFTDFHLFDRLPAGPDVADRARHYLARLQLDHKVRLDGDRLSTTALSHGQRKRLALLSAYLQDRPCYVFDEWAADQDPVFRDLFYRELLPELTARDKAVVVISHDDRYFAVADRLVRLDYGQIRTDPDPVLAGQAVAARPEPGRSRP